MQRRNLQRIADMWLNRSWWLFEQAAGLRDRNAAARAAHRIETAEELREFVRNGGGFAEFLAKKAGSKHPKRAVGIFAGLLAFLVLLTVGLVIGLRYMNSSGEATIASSTDADDGSAHVLADKNLIFTDIDRTMCQGVRITGNPVRIRPTLGTGDAAIGEAYAPDIYPYLGESDDENGVRWFKIQYKSDRAGWVTSELAQKVYPMPSDVADPMFAEIAEKYTAMGAQIAMIRGGKVSRLSSYGYAELNGRKMADGVAIRSASLSKIALAMNAFKLQEEGVLNLNYPLSQYWGFSICSPEYPENELNLNMLLDETSGFAYIDPSGYNMEKTVNALKSGSTFMKERKPGQPSAWGYRNFGIGVAGTTMELAVTGSLLNYSEDWMRDELGIGASFASGRLSKSRLAALYYPSHVESRSVEQLSEKVGSDVKGDNISLWAGGLTISAGDMAKLVSVLANDGVYSGQDGDVRVLSAESVEEMEKQLFQVDDQESNSSFIQCTPMRYIENKYGQSRLYYHTGNAYGVLSIAAYNPETRNGVVAITTGAQDMRDENGIYKICAELLQFGFAELDA